MPIKKIILILSIVLLFSGCQSANDQQSTQQAQMKHEVTQDNANYNDYSHVHYTKQQVEPNGQQQEVTYVDREKLTDSITRLVLTNDEVGEAATLVTDQYVLVAYTTASENREEVADQVKRSALSIAPHYYDVYISDNENHFDEIERFRGLNAHSNSEEAIEQTIELFKQSPQGPKSEEID